MITRYFKYSPLLKLYQDSLNNQQRLAEIEKFIHVNNKVMAYFVLRQSHRKPHRAEELCERIASCQFNSDNFWELSRVLAYMHHMLPAKQTLIESKLQSGQNLVNAAEQLYLSRLVIRQTQEINKCIKARAERMCFDLIDNYLLVLNDVQYYLDNHDGLGMGAVRFLQRLIVDGDIMLSRSQLRLFITRCISERYDHLDNIIGIYLNDHYDAIDIEQDKFVFTGLRDALHLFHSKLKPAYLLVGMFSVVKSADRLLIEITKLIALAKSINVQQMACCELAVYYQHLNALVAAQHHLETLLKKDYFHDKSAKLNTYKYIQAIGIQLYQKWANTTQDQTNTLLLWSAKKVVHTEAQFKKIKEEVLVHKVIENPKLEVVLQDPLNLDKVLKVVDHQSLSTRVKLRIYQLCIKSANPQYSTYAKLLQGSTIDLAVYLANYAIFANLNLKIECQHLVEALQYLQTANVSYDQLTALSPQDRRYLSKIKQSMRTGRLQEPPKGSILGQMYKHIQQIL